MTLSNFEFLRERLPKLYRFARLADESIVTDPFAARVHMKAAVNEVISLLSKDNGISVTSADYGGIIHSLWKSHAISDDVYIALRETELFDIHESEVVVDLSRNKHIFRRVYDFLIWFYQTYVDDAYVPVAYVEPAEQANAVATLQREALDHKPTSAILIDGIVHTAEWSRSLHTLANYGVSQYENGEKYEGQLERGFKQGKGIYTWDDGTIYKGQWNKDLEHGYGEKIFANGDVYRGGWKNGLFAGQGIYQWADGASYDGQWQDGLEQGLGIRTDAEGSKKEGVWTYGEFVKGR